MKSQGKKINFQNEFLNQFIKYFHCLKQGMKKHCRIYHTFLHTSTKSLTSFNLVYLLFFFKPEEKNPSVFKVSFNPRITKITITKN